MSNVVTQTQGPGGLKITIQWTADPSGNATVAVAGLAGVLMRVVTHPGPAAPTDNYDLTLTDEAGVDVFNSQGQNRDSATSEQFCPGVTVSDGTNNTVTPPAIGSDCTLNVSGAGNGGQGTVYLFLI